MEKAQAAADTCYDSVRTSSDRSAQSAMPTADNSDSPKKEGFISSYMKSNQTDIPRTLATISLIGVLAGVFLMRRK